MNFLRKYFDLIIKEPYICTRNKAIATGALAQLVEQRTENPCVPGSIPGGTTSNIKTSIFYRGFFIYIYFREL